MEGDSTEFEEKEYEEYISDLAKSVAQKHVRLTDREKVLITGIFRQNPEKMIKKSLGLELNHCVQ
jgi:hypothetical protein